jgi:hypothetical protein
MILRKRGALSGVLAVSSILNLAVFSAVGQEQTAPIASRDSGELASLKAILEAQQKQIDQLRLALEDQRKLLERAVLSASAGTSGVAPSTTASFKLPEAAKLGEVASNTPIIPSVQPAGTLSPQAGGAEEASPLYFKIGTARFTPLGFIDVTSVFRSTNTGNGIGTSFGGIPYGNAVAGNATENRFSLQNSRVGLRVDSHAVGGDIIGYLETDFLGNAANNLLVTSNSDVLRLRLFWFDYRKDKFEILAGQTWSLLTPNRKGISALPADLFFSQNIDTNYQVGLSWTRAPEFRFLYHANDHVTGAFALENPEQYVGTAVTFPAGLPTTYGSQFSTGASNSNAPNLHPDLMAKLAFDGTPGGRAAHFEVGGVYRSFQAYNSATSSKSITGGGGAEVNGNVEVAPNFRLIANTFFGSGIGRYIFGLAPDVIAKQDGTLSTVDAGSAVGGFEFSHKPKDNPKNLETLLYGYYGGLYIRNDFTVDAKGKYSGYGFPGSGLGTNRAIQEVTFGLTQTLWKNPLFGDLKLMTQYSYLTRDPWSPVTGSPSNAASHMVFVNLRYDLP